MTSNTRSLHRVQPAIAACLLAIGLVFRLYALSDKLVWHDEVATRILSAGYTTSDCKTDLYTGRVLPVEEVLRYQHHNPDRSIVDGVRDLAAHDPQHPPLYYVLAGVWVSLLGDGIGTLRALSVGFSLLGLAAMYWLCIELSGSRRVAWFGVILGAISPLFILYAQEAREYALWCVFIVSSNAALLRARRIAKEGSGRERRVVGAWALYAVTTALGLYTSFSTASVILAQILYIVVTERGRITRISVGAASALTVTGAVFLPWAINLARNFEAFRASMAWSTVIVIPRLALIRILCLNVSRTVLDFWPELEQTKPIAVVVDVSAALFVAAALVYVARRTPKETSLLVFAVVLVPIGMLIVPDLIFGGVRSISGRYMMASWIGVEVALALMLGSLETDRWAFRLTVPALVAVCLVSDLYDARQIAPWSKGVSVHLPEVADLINRAPRPLVVGNAERHNSGNLLALADRLKSGTRMQLLPIGSEVAWVSPPDAGDIYLYSPNVQFREALEAREHVRCRLLEEDVFLELWKVEPAP